MSQKFDQYLTKPAPGIPFWLRKYRYLSYALVFGLFAYLLFQYWQTLNPAYAQGRSASSAGGVGVQLLTPEHLFPGNENQQEFELIIDYAKIPAFTTLTVAIDSPDKNVGFSREAFTFTNDSTYEETNKAVVYYKDGTASAKYFEMRAIVKMGSEEGSISRTIRVDNSSENSLILLSVALAGGLALFNLIKQISSAVKGSAEG